MGCIMQKNREIIACWFLSLDPERDAESRSDLSGFCAEEIHGIAEMQEAAIQKKIKATYASVGSQSLAGMYYHTAITINPRYGKWWITHRIMKDMGSTGLSTSMGM